ncbi:MAG: hypothetical protein ACLKAK_06890 [Alkaliphilus sp.]
MYYSKQIILEKEEDKEKIHNKIIICGYSIVASKEKQDIYKFPFSEVETDSAFWFWLRYNTLKDFYLKTRVNYDREQLKLQISVIPKLISVTFAGHIMVVLLSLYMIARQFLRGIDCFRLLSVVIILFAITYNYLKMRLVFKGRIKRLLDNFHKLD